jgi:hypothetical protein
MANCGNFGRKKKVWLIICYNMVKCIKLMLRICVCICYNCCEYCCKRNMKFNDSVARSKVKYCYPLEYLIKMYSLYIVYVIVE